MGLYLDKIPSVALKTRYHGNAPPKTYIFALMTFFLESISYRTSFSNSAQAGAERPMVYYYNSNSGSLRSPMVKVSKIFLYY